MYYVHYFSERIISLVIDYRNFVKKYKTFVLLLEPLIRSFVYAPKR